MRRAIHVAIPTALATLLLLWFLVEEGRTARAERLLHQLPATAKAVVRVDVRSLARDESMLALFDALTGQGELSTIQVECDIDPRTTIDELVVWAGGPDDRPFQTVGLLITGGSIDAERFAQCYRTLVEARGSQVTRLTATNRVVLGSTDGRSALAEVDERTVVTGSPGTVAEFMAVSGGATPALFENAAFRALWSRVSEGPAGGAFVAPPRWRDAIARVGAINEQTSALEGVEAMGVATDHRRPGTMAVLFDVEDEATARRDAALIEVWAASPPETVPTSWHDLIQSAEVSTTDDEVRVDLDLAIRSASPE